MASLRRFRAKVPAFCSQCGAPRDRKAKFCESCGVDFAELDRAGTGGAAPTIAVPSPTAGSATPPEPATPQAASYTPAPAPPPPAPPPAPQPQIIYQQAPPPQVVYQQPPAPPPPPPAPAPGPGSVMRRPLFTTTVGRVDLNVRPVTFLAGILLAVSTAFTWLDAPGASSSAFKVPFDFLFDAHTTSTGFKLGVALLLLGIGGSVLSALPTASPLRRSCGLAAMAASIAFAAQLGVLVHDAGGTVGDFFGDLGAGPYLAFVGGFFLAVEHR